MNQSNGLRERTYRFGLDVIRAQKKLPNDRPCWIIADQILRSSLSIGANVHEAQGSGSRKEYKHFFETALKSARETAYWLRILKGAGYVEPTVSSALDLELYEITCMLVAAVKKLKAL